MKYQQGNLGNLAILEKMTFFTQKILFFKIESCLSLVDRFRIELSDTIFKIRKKIKNESCLLKKTTIGYHYHYHHHGF